MENLNIWVLFITSTGVLWVFLAAIYLYQTNASILEKKGYKSEYIDFIKKDTTKRLLGMAVVVPLLLLAAALLIRWIMGEPFTPKHLIYTACLFLLFVLPFPILDMRSTRKKYKELAINTKTDVVVDLNFRTQHRIFKPSLEVVTGILYAAYFALFISLMHLGVLHLVLLWCLYFAARSGKHLTRPGMKDTYLLIFLFLMLNHLLMGFHLVRRLMCKTCPFTLYGYILGIFLALLLLIKVVYYLVNFPGFRKQLMKT
jgi:hypothetical protein